MIIIIWIQEVSSSSFYQEFLDYVFDFAENVTVGVDIVLKGFLELKDGRRVGRENGYTLFISLASVTPEPVENIHLFGPSNMLSPLNIDKLSVKEFRSNIDVSIAVDDDPLNFNEDHPCFLIKARCFKFEENLHKYLDEINFKFSDSSEFKPYQVKEKKKKE